MNLHLAPILTDTRKLSPDVRSHYLYSKVKYSVEILFECDECGRVVFWSLSLAHGWVASCVSLDSSPVVVPTELPLVGPTDRVGRERGHSSLQMLQMWQRERAREGLLSRKVWGM